jgi:hypothetical protein
VGLARSPGAGAPCWQPLAPPQRQAQPAEDDRQGNPGGQLEGCDCLSGNPFPSIVRCEDQSGVAYLDPPLLRMHNCIEIDAWANHRPWFLVLLPQNLTAVTDNQPLIFRSNDSMVRIGGDWIRKLPLLAVC